MRAQLWERVVLAQWASALQNSAMKETDMESSMPQILGTEFVRQVIRSHRVL